jgi:putative salt-induced outer membrane protein YdiY
MRDIKNPHANSLISTLNRQNPNTNMLSRPSKSTRPVLATALVLALSSLAAQAGGSSGKSGKDIIGSGVDPISPWEVTGAAGIGLTRGNNDTLNISAQLLATYLEGSNEGLLGIDYAYGEDGSATTVNNLHGFAAYNRTLAGSFYGGLLAEGWYDEITNLDYRLSVMPTLGYYLIKNDSTLLAIEANVGYVWEDQDGTRDYLAYRLGQRFSHKTASGVKITESISWMPEIDDSENWLLIAQAGIAVPVSDHWAVGVSGRYTVDNSPAAGLDKDDLAVLATISYSLKGFAPEAAAERRTLKAEKKAPGLPDMGWSRMAGLSFGMTRGNSETLSLTAGLGIDYRSAGGEWLNSAAVAYGETGSDTNVENIRAATQYNFTLTDVLYAGVGTGFRYDDIAAVDYQVTPAAVLGAYLIKNSTAKLSFPTVSS